MIRFFRKLLILCLIFLVILATVIYIVSKTDKTISRIDVVSNDGLVYISKQGLIDNISRVGDKEWFDIDVEGIENSLYAIKGVDYALVKKVWPSTLVIYLFDRKPIAYWNNNQVLLENMDIITPEVFTFNGNLPYIESSDVEGRDYIFETYQDLNDIVKSNSLSILKVTYKGNQFNLLLSNDMQVMLGSSKLQSRLQLFLESYQKVKDYKSVEYFDMRYSDGFTVKYK
ncbi:cell division protein FtsQ/DivIB [Francisellaceae bacterium CB52]|jgi:cell division protein FtsQ